MVHSPSPADGSAFSLLDRFPATPVGHLKFLEFVRDEVHYAAEAKREQLQREYSNATIDSMVGGIKWGEAGHRVGELGSLPGDSVEDVARILRRELTSSTVERIDELLTPAIRQLRDSWEDGSSLEPLKATNAVTEPRRASPTEEADEPAAPAAERVDATAAAKPKKKRSTERGEARAKLIAALTEHHQYANGGCPNLEPVGSNELARLAKVSKSSASQFFNKVFAGHTKYRTSCRDATKLIAALKLLNQEFAPHHLFGNKPPGEDERADEE